jgi:hypothetical protein
MDSTSRVTKGRIHVEDERNIANKNQDAIVENVSNKHDETNVESKGNEVENSSFGICLTFDVLMSLESTNVFKISLTLTSSSLQAFLFLRILFIMSSFELENILARSATLTPVFEDPVRELQLS